MEGFCVRLRPYDPTTGQLRKLYKVVLADDKPLFRQGEWHEDIHPALAAYLRDHVKGHTGNGAPPAFDVCTKAESRQIIINEKMARLGRSVQAVENAEPVLPRTAGGGVSVDLNLPDQTHEFEVSPSPAADLMEEAKPKPKSKPKPKAKRKKAAPKKAPPKKKAPTRRSRKR